jgi:hypothetical protein
MLVSVCDLYEVLSLYYNEAFQNLVNSPPLLSVCFFRPVGKASVALLYQGPRFRKHSRNVYEWNVKITVHLCQKIFLHISLCASTIGVTGWGWGGGYFDSFSLSHNE